MELYYQILSIIDSICDAMIDGYCCVVFTKPFLDRKAKAWLAGAVYTVSMLFFDFMPWYIDGTLAHILGTIILFTTMYLIDREYITQKFFLTITFFCLRWQASRIVVYIYNGIYGHIIRSCTSTSEIFWFLLTVFFTFLAYDLFIFLFLYSAIRCILWSYGREREPMNSKEFLLLFIPSLSGVVSYGVTRYYSYIYERDTAGKSVYDLFGYHDLILLLFTLLSFAVILVTTYVFRQWKTQQEEDRQREIFSAQMADLKNHIGEVEQLYRDMRSLRHDMGNHLMTLKQLYDKGEYNEAQQYTDKLNKEMAKASLDINSGNPVTDVILSGKKMEMEEKGIAFFCDFHYPMTESIDSFDISIILNNALSNAIEAIERENFKENEAHVSLVSTHRKNMYIIEVANSYRGKLDTDPKSGLPRTCKSGEGHGFGLANIRHVARKYLGDIEIGKEVYEGRECCVLHVMLQIPKD